MTSRRRSRFYALLIGLLVATSAVTSWCCCTSRFYALLIGLLVATAPAWVTVAHWSFYALLIGLLVATNGARCNRTARPRSFYALLIGLLVAT